MTSDDRGIAALIEVLEQVRRRPGLFTGFQEDVGPVVTWLSGFQTACTILGYKCGPDIERQVLRENGWERRADGVVGQMAERGMSPEEIVRALLMLEIEQLRRLAEAQHDSR